jgi:hypothetical protein
MIEKWFHAMNYTRILIDFIFIAQYKSHHDSTLSYLDQTLFQLNAYKKIFRYSRLKEHEIEKNHFKFSKFHAITHYVDFIRRYEVANEYDTSHDETWHKYMIKKFYSRINKREIFQTQLIEHNKRRLNILALKDLKRHMKENSRSKKIEFTHTQASRDSLNLKLIEIISRSINQFSRRNSSQNSIHWCSIRKLDVKIRISDLTSIAVVFVREQRLKKTKESSNSRIRFQRESDFNWFMNYDVCLHELITCWIRNEHNSLNMKELIKKKIRSKSNWQNQIENWRRDYVWIREEFFDQTFFSFFEKKLIDQIYCIFIIRDSNVRNHKNKSLTYTNVMLNIKHSRHKRIFNLINEMIELKNWRDEIARNFKNLKVNKIYDISIVIQSAHVTLNEFEHYYVNNYVNWDTYNIIYDENFLKKRIKRVEMFKRSCF